MKSIVIIGKGTSVLNSTKEFIDQHDKVCIINEVIYSPKYTPYISNRADYQFANSTVNYYKREIFDTLGITKIFFHGRENQKFKKSPDYYKDIEFKYINPNLHTLFTTNFNFDPSGGVQAFYYFTEIEPYDVVSLVGFDFYELNSTPYYFNPSEGGAHVKWLMSNPYKGNKINVPSGHNTEKSIDFVQNQMLKKPNIKFNIISNNLNLKKVTNPNINYIK